MASDTPTRRIVPAEATEEMLLQGMIAKATRAEEIDGPIAPLPTDRDPTIDEVGDYCTRTALRISSNIEIEAVWNAMLAASPASGKVGEAEVEKAAKAIWDCANLDGTDPEWNDLSDLNKEHCRNLARAAIAALGLEVE